MDWEALVRRNAQHLEEGLAVACSLAGLEPSGVLVMAVTKNLPGEAARAAYAAGFRLFGENRVQEAAEKASSGVFGDARLELIGHLQSNKAKVAVETFHAVQSLDSETAARELQRRASQAGREIDVLLEYNTSGETQKYGMRTWKELTELAGLVQGLPQLHLRGLMTMATFVSEEKTVRRSFSLLRETRDRLRAETGLPLPVLSMGMSQDYHWAVMEGSTMIRIGTLLFGARP